jgi:hypothetical protein
MGIPRAPGDLLDAIQGRSRSLDEIHEPNGAATVASHPDQSQGYDGIAEPQFVGVSDSRLRSSLIFPRSPACNGDYELFHLEAPENDMGEQFGHRCAIASHNHAFSRSR